MKKLDVLAGVLLVVGGLNWGLVAIARFDLVAALFGREYGETNLVTRLVYGLVGLSAVYVIAQLGAIRQRWTPIYGARAGDARLGTAGVR